VQTGGQNDTFIGPFHGLAIRPLFEST